MRSLDTAPLAALTRLLVSSALYRNSIAGNSYNIALGYFAAGNLFTMGSQ